MSEARRQIERVARLSYGRLVAILSARLGSPHRAEEMLAESLLAALETWPERGVPDNPEGWLLKTARRKAIDAWRREATAHAGQQEIIAMIEERTAQVGDGAADPRLNLMFVCAHPAIDAAIRAPLMLQLVLGLDARRMASVFLVAPGTLGQRLTRAKAKIETSAIGFELPDEADRPARVADVLDAIYAAYAVGYNGMPAGDRKAADLTQEAIWLVSLICAELPGEAEAHGLFATMLFAEARRPARLDPQTGALVPLGRQDPANWNARLLDDAERALANAARHASLGRYQLEAAIQAVHAARRRTAETDWDELERLYRGLVAIAPTIGARTGHAAVLIEAAGPETALDALDAMPEVQRRSYQPWWATRAHALARLGHKADAHEAFARAIGLSDDEAARRYLWTQADMLRPR
ncbi:MULTISPECIES: DUF6596 domain-containing protein [unclassified Roseitalea]|uniref:RNA polymerase sigma factor n=1 Tax=unclassified Roseitalea TaxID=2639107 RepID=UPI00273FB5E5|nr:MULTISPECIES: DUF6596 domain-containing protein [unclassified Roseitalea]